jgi:long-chain acyl-CoA synthetase
MDSNNNSDAHPGTVALSGRVAFVSDGECWSYERFEVTIVRLVAGLLKLGIQVADRVALHLRNGPEIAAAYFACFRIGAIAVPVNLQLNPVQLQDALKRVTPSLYIGDTALHSLVAYVDTSVLHADRRYVVGASTDGSLRNWTDLLGEPSSKTFRNDTNGDAPAVLLLTPGTTSQPKLVAHSVNTLNSAVNQFACLGINEGGSMVFLRSMTHGSGLFHLLHGIRQKLTFVFLDTSDAASILDAIENHHCTYLPAPVESCTALTKLQRANPRDISSLRACSVSADVCPPGRQEEFKEVFGVDLKSFFSSTEGTFSFTYGLKSGAVGKLRAGAEAKLVDDDDLPVAKGEVGELLVRGPHVMLGYWTGPGRMGGLNDGWFRSGDMMRQDEQGQFWFVSRRIDLILRAGSSISPVEVEHILAQHSSVRDAAVVGVPDVLVGQRVVGFVQLGDGVEVDRLPEILESIRNCLADYKVPDRLVPVAVIPRNLLGKVDRKELAARLG